MYRRDTFTGTIDVFPNLGIALNGNITIPTALQYRRHVMFVKAISAHRGNLSAAIDTLFNLSIAFDSDSSITTHQGRVSMCLYTCTATEDATHDSRSKCTSGCSGSTSYLHLGISLHAAYLAAAIDVLVHRAVFDVDIRAVCDTFLTPEGVVLTPTGSIHMSINDRRTTIDCHIANACVLFIACSIGSAVSILPIKRPHILRNGKCSYTA